MRRDYHDNRNEDASGLSAFMAGALIGAGVALLFAPQSGTELRGMLRDYTHRAKEDFMERGEEAFDTAVEQGQEFYEKGEELVQDAGRSAKEFAKQGVKQGQQAGKDAGRAAKEFATQTKEAAQG